MILSVLCLGLSPLALFQEPEETKLEAAQRKVTELEAELGPEHLDVAEALNDLMMVHFGQAQYAKAAEVCRRTLSIRKKALDSEHPDVAEALNDLAFLLAKQGAYAEARPLYERALAIWEKARGPEHPDVAGALNNLAILLKNQGSYAEARPFYERGLETTLLHLSKNLGAMTETERFQYLATKKGPEPLLLNLIAMGSGGEVND